MKKTTLQKLTCSLFFLFAGATILFAQWQKVDLTKAGGGTVDPNMYQMALENSKLYVATNDGIWESASANGADWTAYGLQGKRVFLISFDALKLAITVETATDDATKKTLQVYKQNGTDWVNTNFNPSKLAVFGTALDNLINFAQIQNGNQTVIVVPTWGNGIWRSADGGDTWTKSAYAPCEATPNAEFYKKVPGIYSFPNDPIVYGTDKPSGDNYASNMQYVIYSEDFGITWKNLPVANFFNPWSFHKRSVGGKSYFYWGGKDGNQGIVWRSEDAGLTWPDASITAGVEYWDNRRIIGEDDGPLYAMCSENNVYVSNDNGETFSAVGTGLVIPKPAPRPANEPFFLSHLVKSATKLYVSTTTDGLYSFSLSTSAVKNIREKNLQFYLSVDKSNLSLMTELYAKVSILALDGKLLKTTNATSQQTNISISDLKSGLYMLKVETKEGNSVVEKFVK